MPSSQAPSVGKMLAFVVSLAATLAFAGALPAAAATESVSGSQSGGVTYYGTQRYHAYSQALKFDLGTASGQCGGGQFRLRGLRTSGTWLTDWVGWNIFTSSYATRTWAAAGTKPSGYFKLVGNLIGDCGPGIPLTIRFTGKIYF